ncbi:MAG: hypothetical protein DMG14_00280 [Acidobacteria bacterium]|nr:MAG: hypothetical protein DMG14_00280 [Acidobacteriota bacterium]
MPMASRLRITALLLVLSALSLHAQRGTGKPAHILHAVRTVEKITLDGNLNDAAWMKAPVEWDFTQRDPIEGQDPTERTEVRILYDDASIYFGVRLFDAEPQKIVRQLSRRDDYADADRLTIQLSPNHDRLTGVQFEVSAAGVQRDAIISNDVFTDNSWDGVWESAVRVDDEGWSVEMRIPFSQLRFPPGDHQVWGINAARYIHRKNETVWLQMVPKKESGTASRMDDLQGIDGLERHRHLDLMPYTVGRTQLIRPSVPTDPFNDGSRIFGATGLDIKYGISSNLTLDATVNPDFGQVEVDPAVVNLSAFETFFPEKRPFFLEGANIFANFGQGGSNNFWGFNRQEPNLFYTRRIGRAPQGTASGDFVDMPGSTTILGAGKLTGKTRNGWTLGLLEAVTGRESADVLLEGRRAHVEVEPLTNYLVARVLKESARAGVGFLTTAVDRDVRLPALRDLLPKRGHVAGADAYWFLDSKKDWVITGKFAGSWVNGSVASIDRLQRSPQHYFQRPDAREVSLRPGATSMKGTTGDINLNRQTGNVLVNAALWGVSPGFESNDIGFQTGGDVAGAHAVVLWRKTTPDHFTRDRNVWVAKWWKWNYGRRLLGNGWNAAVNAQFLNYWRVFVNGGLSRQTHDDRLTRGGPSAVATSGSFLGTGFNSDSRKKVSFNGFFGAGRNKPNAWNANGDVGITYKPSPSITISTGPSFGRSRGNAQYVTSVQDATATRTFGGRYVFADIDQTSVSLTTRVNWILGPKMSLQVYVQPLISVGDYWDFKELARPNTFSFMRYGHEIGEISVDANRQYTVYPDADGSAPPFTFKDPDFNFKSLRVNAIFRWEWRLGSTLYFVWTENRQDLSNPGRFDPRQDVARLFSAHPDDIFLVRLAYWFSR